MTHLAEQAFAAGRRVRQDVASAIISFGVRLHLAVQDLGLWLEPELVLRDDGRRRSPWPGILVVGLLTIGAVTVGYCAGAVIREAMPSREVVS